MFNLLLTTSTPVVSDPDALERLVKILLAAGVCSALMPADAGGAAPVLTVIIYAAMVVGILMYVICCNKLAKAFGKGMGYTLGLIFLNPVFLLILGLGGAQYQGADL